MESVHRLNGSDETIALEDFLLFLFSPVLKPAFKLRSGELHHASLVVVIIKLRMIGQRVARRHEREREIS